MTTHPLARPKWILPEFSRLSTLTHDAVRAAVEANAARQDDIGWPELASSRTLDLLPADQVASLLRDVVEAYKAEVGRPLLASAEVSVTEDPDLYVLKSAWEAAQAARTDLGELPPGVIGMGDNVFQAQDVTGKVITLREVAVVQHFMEHGVPEGSIGIIDDSGGTLTAPVLADFDGIVCRAGTVRSHLAILAREFNVPTVMGAVFARPPVDGETITVSYSVQSQNADAYHGGKVNPRANILEVEQS